jgi:hypothetical protein
MRVMVFAKADGENVVPTTAAVFAAMDRFTEELVKAGVFVAAAGLLGIALWLAGEVLAAARAGNAFAARPALS